MEYSINELSQLAGISTRTLRYYDEIGLLSARRMDNSNYRVYGQNEVDLLHQILFFRSLDIPLDEIKKIILANNYDGATALQEHLLKLKDKKKQIKLLIKNVEQTIATLKGEVTMSNEEKFAYFKQNLINENEKTYGEEIRQKFGDDIIDASNAKMMNLTKEQYEKVQALSAKINELLKVAFEEGDPAGETAQNVCVLHEEWLSYFWAHYSKEAHLGLAQTYVADPRFKKYYDDIIIGGAEFLYKALQVYCK